MLSHGCWGSPTTLCEMPDEDSADTAPSWSGSLLRRLPLRPKIRSSLADTEAGLRAALDAVTTLPEGEREAVMLVLWSGLSYEDAAIALAIPVGTVRSRLSHARTKLQTSLGNPALSLTKESS